jgi:two-component system nitrogen regulation sensor histidine kinase GlnL
MVQKLVREMNGRITHDRDAATGLTHFRVHLPVAAERPMPAQREASAK